VLKRLRNAKYFRSSAEKRKLEPYVIPESARKEADNFPKIQTEEELGANNIGIK
jgi:hypothetical protein